MRRNATSLLLSLPVVVFMLTGGTRSQAATPTKATYAGWLVYDSKTNLIWYADPVAGYRYSMTKPSTLRAIAARAAYVIPPERLALIPETGSTEVGDLTQRKRYAGKFVVTTSTPNQYWYIQPSTKTRINLSTVTNALQAARQYGRRSDATFYKLWTTDPGPRSLQQRVVTSRGTFTVSVVRANLNNPQIRLMTDNLAPGYGTCSCSCNPESLCNAAYHALCPTTCSVQSFATFVRRRSALAAINGTYFHTPPYFTTEINKSDLAVMNSFQTKQEITRNPFDPASKLEHPVVIDTANHVYTNLPNISCQPVYKNIGLNGQGEEITFGVFTDCVRSAAKSAIQAQGGTGSIQALMSTDAFLVLNGRNVIQQYPLDTKQKTSRTTRDFFGIRGRTIYFVVVRGATMYDAAAVATAMKFDMAANLDGGASSALYANGKYLVSPGRNIPNALLLTR